MASEQLSPVVFYSWQSDLPNRTNRGLIEDALEGACRELSAELALAVRVDSDTQGESGSPDIAATIFEKIERSSVVVADVSIIGLAAIGSGSSSTRPVPNPNVMIELGYAKRALGLKRVIMICNTAFGRIEDLPFDIRGKSVLSYSFSGDDGDKPANSRSTLRAKLKGALSAALEAAKTPIDTEDPLAKDKKRRAAMERFDALRKIRVQEVIDSPAAPLLGELPLMVLHLAPVASLDSEQRIDLVDDLAKIRNEFVPYAASSWRHITHEDSVTAVGAERGQLALGYTRIYETGLIQYVATVSTTKNLNPIAYKAVEALTRIRAAPAKLGFSGDLIVSLDVARTKGTQFSVPAPWGQLDDSARPIDRDLLSPPLIYAESLQENDIPKLLRPALDRIWRNGGLERCFFINEQGRLLPP